VCAYTQGVTPPSPDTPLTIGELCAGYGGLGMGVSRVLDAEVVWYAEVDKGALKVLTHRFPDVPNVGDMTAVDWSSVPPVDVLCGGTPCQDLSHAGKRAGMTEGTRSNLWVAMREAIAVLRPSLVIWENVEGAASAGADSDLESCPGCVGDARDRGPVLRALGRVVGDLSSLGYVGCVGTLRAADAGAPHGRRRRFLAARDAAGGREWSSLIRGRGIGQPAGPARGADRGALLPTPAAYDEDRGGPQHPDKRLAGGHAVTLQDAVHGLLPTPRATDGTKGGPNQRGSSGNLMLPSAVTLLPTPTAGDSVGTGYATGWDELTQADGRHRLRDATNVRSLKADWGDYAAAIARWEHITRPAPEPTMLSRKGTPQLSPAFSEWMMGLPAGWVTDTPGITRNEALRALGNGVVPQQAEAAVRFLLGTLDTPR
jgi:DNA (cytosine-5)-methyltransferase 1